MSPEQPSPDALLQRAAAQVRAESEGGPPMSPALSLLHEALQHAALWQVTAERRGNTILAAAQMTEQRAQQQPSEDAQGESSMTSPRPPRGVIDPSVHVPPEGMTAQEQAEREQAEIDARQHQLADAEPATGEEPA